MKGLCRCVPPFRACQGASVSNTTLSGLPVIHPPSPPSPPALLHPQHPQPGDAKKHLWEVNNPLPYITPSATIQCIYTPKLPPPSSLITLLACSCNSFPLLYSELLMSCCMSLPVGPPLLMNAPAFDSHLYPTFTHLLPFAIISYISIIPRSNFT